MDARKKQGTITSSGKRHTLSQYIVSSGRQDCHSFGPVQRGYDDNLVKSALTTQIEGSRIEARWMDRVKQDMKQNKIRPEWGVQSERAGSK